MGTEAAEIREAIEQTRAELGETVQALAYKTDVKARAQDKVEDAKRKGQESAERVRHKVAGAAHSATQVVPARRRSFPIVAAIAGVAGLILVLRLKSRGSRTS